MTTTTNPLPTELCRQAAEFIARAAAAEIELAPADFQVVDGDLYLDGMDPGEWIDAMTMD